MTTTRCVVASGMPPDGAARGRFATCVGGAVSQRLRTLAGEVARARSLAGCFVMFGALASATAQELHLDLVGRFVSPISAIDGASLSNRRIAVWGTAASSLYLLDGQAWRQLCGDRTIHPIGATIRAGDTVEFLSANPLKRYRATFTSCTELKAQLASESITQAAAFTQNRWFLLGSDRVGRARVWVLKDGVVTATETFPLEARTTLITPSFRGILLSAMRFPFGWSHVSDSGSRAEYKTPLETSDFATPLPLLVALGTFALDAGFLRVVADPRSDRRVLIRFDNAGGFVKRSILEAPWGIVATSEKTQMLLALQDVDQPELLLYRWRWDKH